MRCHTDFTDHILPRRFIESPYYYSKCLVARIARIVVSGLPHPVTQRGDARGQEFFEKVDYALYRDILSDSFVPGAAWPRQSPCGLWSNAEQHARCGPAIAADICLRALICAPAGPCRRLNSVWGQDQARQPVAGLIGTAMHHRSLQQAINPIPGIVSSRQFASCMRCQAFSFFSRAPMRTSTARICSIKSRSVSHSRSGQLRNAFVFMIFNDVYQLADVAGAD